MKLVVYLIFLALFVSCVSKNQTEAVALTKYDLEFVEPFIVEHYKFVTELDTSIWLYLNRDVDTVDFPGVKIQVKFDHPTDYCFAFVPFEIKSENRVIKIPISKIDQSNFDQRGNIDIKTAIYDHIQGRRIIKEISFAHGTSNCPFERFSENSWVLNSSAMLTFNENSFERGKKYNRFCQTHIWSACRFQFFKGKFDKQGKKQGEWIWYFSNKQPMIRAKFNNDTLVDGLNGVTMYNYSGDSIAKHYY